MLRSLKKLKLWQKLKKEIALNVALQKKDEEIKSFVMTLAGIIITINKNQSTPTTCAMW
jgi:hypothetical protein